MSQQLYEQLKDILTSLGWVLEEEDSYSNILRANFILDQEKLDLASIKKQLKMNSLKFYSDKDSEYFTIAAEDPTKGEWEMHFATASARMYEPPLTAELTVFLPAKKSEKRKVKVGYLPGTKNEDKY